MAALLTVLALFAASILVAIRVRSLIINIFRRIFTDMAGATAMLKMKRSVPKARPRDEAVSLSTVYRDTMKRYPKTMALLAE